MFLLFFSNFLKFSSMECCVTFLNCLFLILSVSPLVFSFFFGLLAEVPVCYRCSTLSLLDTNYLLQMSSVNFIVCNISLSSPSHPDSHWVLHPLLRCLSDLHTSILPLCLCVNLALYHLLLDYCTNFLHFLQSHSYIFAVFCIIKPE